jgi:multicomponent Na+:H+ antiporter subunit D
MPFTATCCIIAAASISGFPFLSGFVTKSMTITAAGNHHMVIIWFLLMFASVGVLEHAGIKVPYFAFFGHDSGMRPKEAPVNMCFAMGIAAFLCIAIGLYPYPLYDMLPYPVVDFAPYTGAHVVGMAQLLLFAAAAFVLLLLAGVYPPEKRCVNLDMDWFYRKGGKLFYWVADKVFNGINGVSDRLIARGVPRFLGRLSRCVPEILALGALLPFWTATGTKGDALQRKVDRTRAALEAGAVPVGISAAVATIFLVFLFVLM